MKGRAMSILDISALLADTTPQGNAKRHERMMTLWIEAKRLRKEGNAILADQYKAAGNELHRRNQRPITITLKVTNPEPATKVIALDVITPDLPEDESRHSAIGRD